MKSSQNEYYYRFSAKRQYQICYRHTTDATEFNKLFMFVSSVQISHKKKLYYMHLFAHICLSTIQSSTP